MWLYEHRPCHTGCSAWLSNGGNQEFFSYDIANSDDTGIQVLKEDGSHAASQSALLIRRGSPPYQTVVLVDYALSKSREPPPDSCLNSRAPWFAMVRPASTSSLGARD